MGINRIHDDRTRALALLTSRIGVHCLDEIAQTIGSGEALTMVIPIQATLVLLCRGPGKPGGTMQDEKILDHVNNRSQAPALSKKVCQTGKSTPSGRVRYNVPA